MTFLNLEFAACLSTALAIKRYAPKLVNVPLLLKVVHFAFVGFFCIIGIDGCHILVWICFRHWEFIEAFSHSNPFGVNHSLLEYIGYGFAPAGAVLCFASLKLCGLSRRARRIVTIIALPYSILYPCIMLTASQNSHAHSNVNFAFIATAVLSALSAAAMIFYRAKYVGKYLVFS
jgi:hypothetical protein